MKHHAMPIKRRCPCSDCKCDRNADALDARAEEYAQEFSETLHEDFSRLATMGEEKTVNAVFDVVARRKAEIEQQKAA